MCSSEDIYRDLQQQLLDADTICRIELEVITPLLIGGYDARRYHNDLGYESLRESSIKGVWRWWARALIAAALKEDYNICTDLTCLDKLVSKILGGSGSNEGQSKYSILVEPLNSAKVCEGIEICDRTYGEVPRIKLLRRFYDKAIAEGTRFTVAILRNRKTTHTEDKFAVWSLIIALLFDGIGKATSRGFGKFRILNVDKLEKPNNIISRLYSSTSPEHVRDCLKEIIREGVSHAKEVLRSLESFDRYVGKYLEGVSKDNPIVEIALVDKLMIIHVPRREFRNVKDILVTLGHATLKSYWKALDVRRQGLSFGKALREARNIAGKNYHTWILGLPRSQEPLILSDSRREDSVKRELQNAINKIKNSIQADDMKVRELIDLVRVEVERNKVRIPTGYYFLGDSKRDLKLRRKSPIRFTIIPVGKGKYYVAIFAFKTYEWNEILRQLVHVGAHVHRCSFEVAPIASSIKIDEVLKDAIERISKIIEIDRPMR